MKRFSPFRLVCCFLIPAALLAQVEQVLDLRHPGPGIGGILHDWGSDIVAGGQVRFLGDVDGDGLEDVGLDQFNKVLNAVSFIIVYGVPRAILESFPSASGLRRTTFVADDSSTSILDCAPAGDLDQDGHDDFVLGLIYASVNGVNSSGAAFLVFGSAGWPAELPVSELASSVRSLRFVSKEESSHLGEAVSSCGDLNGDGNLDLAISGHGEGTEDGLMGGGRVYVIYGPFDDSPMDIDVSDVGVSRPGVVVRGAYGQGAGRLFDAVGCCREMLRPLGDITGDGLDDLGIGTLGTRSPGSGVLYVLRGSAASSGTLLVANPEEPLVEFEGHPYLGSSLSPAGDVDGDGLGDFVAGAWDDPSEGAAYLIYGSGAWPPRTGKLGASSFTRSFQLLGTGNPYPLLAKGYLGFHAAGIGDWNGDGVPDFAATAHRQSARYESNTGKAYLIYGGPHLEGTANDDDVGTPALPGLKIFGKDSEVQLGDAVDAGRDIDGDGRDDILLSSYHRRLPSSLPRELSTIYILFGGGQAGEHFIAAAVEPPEGSIEGGLTVSVQGAGFPEGAIVFIGGAAAVTRVISSAEIEAVVPPGSLTGSVDLEVRAPDGSSTRLTNGFVYVEPPRYSDLILDASEFASRGHRTLILDNPFHPADGGKGVRRFLPVLFADVTGDGLDDLILGEPSGGSLPRPDRNSRVSILFGRRSGFPERLSIGVGQNFGTAIEGGLEHGNFATHMELSGDLNDDGWDDLVCGRYVLFGRPAWDESLELGTEIAEGTAVELPQDPCRDSRTTALGDFDGNGQADLVMSFESCQRGDGQAYLFLDGLTPGEATPAHSAEILNDPEPVALLHLDVYIPEPYARSFSYPLSAAGDLNGDGLPDFMARANHPAAAVYILLGGEVDYISGTVAELVEAGRAVKVHHDERPLVGFGASLAAAGDVNGDGLDDALIGIVEGGRDQHGEIYVLFGSRDLGTSIREIGVITAGKDRVLQILGEWPDDEAGWVAGLGDYNADGFADIGITASSNRNTTARAYIVFGASDLPRTLELSRLGTRGFRLIGVEGSWLSTWNEGIAAGDLDGDGFMDLALGMAYPEDGIQKRRALVIFGKNPEGVLFTRGDADGSGALDITDAIFILGFLFLGGGAPPCEDAADVDDRGSHEITDAVYLLNYLFSGGPEPPPPHETAGLDPTEDTLGCRGF